MKNIQPVTIWNKGEANRFSLKLISDNLIDKAIFVYELINYTDEEVDVMKGESKYTILVSDNLEIVDSDYQNWSGENEQAFQLCASKLGLTIVN